MVDQVGEEEEYHFQDLGETGEDEPDEQPVDKAPAMESNSMLDMKKKVFIAAGGAILLVIVYNLLAGFFGGKKDTSKVIQKPGQLSSQKPAKAAARQPQIVNRVKPKIVPPKDRPRPVQRPSNMIGQQAQEAFDGLNRMLRSIEVAIKDLDSRVVDLQVNQSKIQKQFDTQKQDAKPKSGIGTKKGSKKIAFKQKYEVVGIIHGRAWLKTPKGSTLTIKPGDKLPGYGSVRMIEPEQGVVIMSSGEVIKFNSN